MSPIDTAPSAPGPERPAARMVRVGTLVTGLLALALTACSPGDGTALRPPTEPPPTSEIDPDEGDDTGDPTEDAPGDIGIETRALELFPPWADGGDLDPYYTCEDAGVSPPLAWTPAPAGTVELVLIMTQTTDTGDSFDDIGVVHWLLAGIGPYLSSIPEGGIPPGALPLENGFGEIGWTAPCPPEGVTAEYRFTLYALGEPLGDVTALPLDSIVDLVWFTSSATAVSAVSFTRSG